MKQSYEVIEEDLEATVSWLSFPSHSNTKYDFKIVTAWGINFTTIWFVVSFVKLG
jgi:hypothetical protein